MDSCSSTANDIFFHFRSQLLLSPLRCLQRLKRLQDWNSQRSVPLLRSIHSNAADVIYLIKQDADDEKQRIDKEIGDGVPATQFQAEQKYLPGVEAALNTQREPSQ